MAFSPELLKLADRRRQALEDCRQAAEDGDANAAVQMGVNCLYGVNGVEKDPKRRFTGFPRRRRTTRRACTGGRCAMTTVWAWTRMRTGPAACIRSRQPMATPRPCATWACAMKAARE